MQFHWLDFGCCQVCLWMSRFWNQVLQTVTPLKARKDSRSLPASFKDPKPCGPLTYHHSESSALLETIRALKSPSKTNVSLDDIACCMAPKNWFLLYLEAAKSWSITGDHMKPLTSYSQTGSNDPIVPCFPLTASWCPCFDSKAHQYKSNTLPSLLYNNISRNLSSWC